jgi:hypothetical protein
MLAGQRAVHAKHPMQSSWYVIAPARFDLPYLQTCGAFQLVCMGVRWKTLSFQVPRRRIEFLETHFAYVTNHAVQSSWCIEFTITSPFQRTLSFQAVCAMRIFQSTPIFTNGA